MSRLVIISGEEARQKSAEELFSELGTGPQGLSDAEAAERLAQYGPNALEEKKEHPLLQFLSYFWGPIS
ncbi:MAG: cation-transporting P-type ATPase [Syntrophobacteraceae bacterium]